jgi:hypothetical protein
MEDRDRFIDDLVDSALAQQQRVEPLPGLEGRILERVRIARSMRASSRKQWTIGPAVAAAVVVMVAAIYVARRPNGPTAHTPKASNIVPAPAPRKTLTANSRTTREEATAAIVPESKPVVRRERKSSRPAEAHHWPSQFPTPAPLTAEEKALVRYVQETPPQVLARQVLKADFTVQRVEIKPLKIAPLEIKPLAVGPTEEETQ